MAGGILKIPCGEITCQKLQPGESLVLPITYGLVMVMPWDINYSLAVSIIISPTDIALTEVVRNNDISTSETAKIQFVRDTSKKIALKNNSATEQSFRVLYIG